MSTECAARTPSHPTDLDYPFELAPWASPTTIPNAVEPSPEKDLVRMKSLTHYGGYGVAYTTPSKAWPYGTNGVFRTELSPSATKS